MYKSNKKITLMILVLLLVSFGVGSAANQLELIAPGGGEMDLEKNLVKYYAADGKLVEARWGESLLQTNYLEYYRDQALIVAQGKVTLSQTGPQKRILNCNEIRVDLNRNHVIAKEEIKLQMSDDLIVSGGLLEWDRNQDQFKLTNNPKIIYQGWVLVGNVIEGKPEKGIFTIVGSVTAVNQDTIIKAGKIVFDRDIEEFYLQDNPVIIRGQNELTATEIVYNLKTKKVTAKGMMKSQVKE